MASRTKACLAYVGCRTTPERGATGTGITTLVRTGDSWHPSATLDTFDNPSWLAQAGRPDRLYSLHGDRSHVSSFACDPETGDLEFLSRVSCGGLNPVHLCPAPDGSALLCANYATGNLATLLLNANGEAEAPRRLSTLPYSQGPHRVEQNGPHPHQIVLSPSGTAALVPDKGADRVCIYSIDPDTYALALEPATVFQARECSGPRHLVFHPRLPISYIVGELNSTVTACAWDDRLHKLIQISTLSTLPQSFCGDSRGAAIQVTSDGRWLFVSNRGHDSIAVFALDDAGNLDRVEVFQTGGRVPRFMTLDPAEKSLWIAHEVSNQILVLALEPSAGLSRESACRIETPSPTSILFQSRAEA